jgi:LPS-assembly protein
MTRRGRALRYGSALLLGVLLAAGGGVTAQAQLKAVINANREPYSQNQPAYYQADSAEYDRDAAIVTLSGHVEIWQGDRVLRADRVTYDRNTGVAAASGHVVLLEPDGETTFADYAELSQGMKNGVLTNIRSQLTQNGRLAANGARRTDARINEFTRVIYSTCDACKDDPLAPLLWDIRARSAVQDLDHRRLEYRDMVVDVLGVPVFWAPYFTNPDPSARRQSGFLPPSIGQSKYIGAFIEQPYFWDIDDSTDMTISPLVGTSDGPAVNMLARRAFNDGMVTVNASVADGRSSDLGNGNSFQGEAVAKGQFAINDEWRWGFDLERTTSLDYIRDFSVDTSALPPTVLASSIYLEAFGQGAYSRLDSSAYQGLNTTINTAKLPYVLPRYQYSFVGEPDALGGRLSLDAGAFNVVRDQGTNTRRVSLSTDWERPVEGALGDMWKLVLHVDSAAYSATQIDQSPTFGSVNVAEAAQAMPTAALELRWPFQRDGSGGGSTLVEPIAQLIAAPQGSSYRTVNGPNGLYVNTKIPDEDSLDYEFTDASLFSLNRFPGIDRLEGGPRANVALHGSWFSATGQIVDAQIGQGYRLRPDDAFPVGSGLEQTVTDLVSHVSYTPNQYFDITARERFDHRDMELRFADALVTTGPSWLHLTGGYIYDRFNPFAYYDTTPTGVLSGPARDEAALGVATNYGHWRLSANVRRDMQLGKMVSAGGTLAYENECIILSVNAGRRFTSLNGDNGDTTLLFQLTLKTVGTFGFNGL